MANIVFNIAKGKVAAFYDRVNDNDPANSALVLIPLETSGLATDATLRDFDTVAALLAGSSNEQTGVGRITLTDSNLAAGAPDDTNDRNDRTLPEVTWVDPPAGNAISKIVVAYDPDTTTGDDSTLVPLTAFDVTWTPDGNDFVLTEAVFFRAS